MKPSLRTKLDSLASRLDEVGGLLAEEKAAKDMESFRRLSREYSELTGVVELYRRFQGTEADAQAARTRYSVSHVQAAYERLLEQHGLRYRGDWRRWLRQQLERVVGPDHGP
jgi:protein subunit release factor A